jgi:hypothetical protein
MIETPMVHAQAPRLPRISGVRGGLTLLNTFPLLLCLGFLRSRKSIFADPRATLVQWGEYHLSWVEVLLVAAAMMAMAEQLWVSHPGIDNTIEATLMGAIAGIQVLLFALGGSRCKVSHAHTGRRCDLDQRQDATADDRCRRQRLKFEPYFLVQRRFEAQRLRLQQSSRLSSRL